MFVQENVQSPDGYGRLLGQMVLLANLTAKGGQMGTISPETIWNYHFWIIIQTFTSIISDLPEVSLSSQVISITVPEQV